MFLSFEPEDEGIYYCNASNSEGWTKSKYARVWLSYLDSITEGPQNRVIITGESVVMRCKIPNGLPLPVVSWYHNTELVQISPLIYLVDGDLHISKVRLEDAGDYQCEVRNRAGRRKSEIAKLIVYQKPRFEIMPTNQQVKVGEDVEFACRADGDPKPTILWRRENGQHIRKDRSALRNDTSFRIFQVRPEDAGTYVCQAKNEAGRIDVSANLIVLSPPSFTITPIDITVAEGEKAVFNCQVSGSPRPYIRWVHNGEYFFYPGFENVNLTGKPRVFIDHKGSLVVTSARKSDEGKYECRASHKTGMVRSSASLFVSDSNPSPIVVIELGPQNQTLLLGTTATLCCEAHLLGSVGLPENLQRDSYSVSLTWLKNGFILTPGNDPRIVIPSQGILQINGIKFSDQGDYICRAKTTPRIDRTQQQPKPLHSAEWMGSLQVTMGPFHPTYRAPVVENLPRPPAAVDIVDVGDSWICVKCTVSPSPAFGNTQDGQVLSEVGLILRSVEVIERLRVRVEYIEIEKNYGWVEVAEVHPDEVLKISSLEPESGYRILARTVSPHGVGRPYILPHSVFTKKRHRYVNFTSHLTDTINSVLLSTPLLNSLSTSEVELTGRVCGAASALSLLTGIRVHYRAVPLARCLPPADASIARYHPSEHCPGYTTTVLNNNLHIDDNIASLSDTYCSLKMLFENSLDYTRDYLPPFSELEHYRFMRLDLVDSAPFRMVLDNLNPFVCYEVEVDAYSEDPTLGRVYSQKSSSPTILTFDSTPSQAPQEVKAQWAGTNNDVLEIMWSAPPTWTTNGLISGFSLRLLSQDSEQSKTLTVGPKVTQYRMENMRPNTNYTLYLAAITCHGEGVRSEPYPIIASHYLKLLGRDATAIFDFTHIFPSNNGSDRGDAFFPSTLSTFVVKLPSTTRHPLDLATVPVGAGLGNHTWFIACLVGVTVLWLLIFVIVVVCCRRRRQRVKQLYPLNSAASCEDLAFRIKSNGSGSDGCGLDRSSKVGLLDTSKESCGLMRQQQHQPFLALTGLLKHNSPRLQMGTAILATNRMVQQPKYQTEAAYEASGSQIATETTKLASTGNIFLVTSGTTSSSSHNSSLHKSLPMAVLEGNGIETLDENLAIGISLEAVADAGKANLHTEPYSVSPYASTSLLEHLHRGSSRVGTGPFSEIIPPPPHYPPPPVPPDTPPPSVQPSCVPSECHYAQSDLQKINDAMFIGAPFIPFIGPVYPQKQYWLNGVHYVQQSVVTTMPSQNGNFYMPRGVGTMPNAVFMTQKSSYCHPGQTVLMMQHQNQRSSCSLTDDVVLPASTLAHSDGNTQIYADN